MPLTSRKRRPPERTQQPLRDTRLVIIATEGRLTEQQYFALFHSSRVQVKVLPSTDDRSAPEYVLERLRRFRADYDLGGDDSLWLMVDEDRWGNAKLADIARAAGQSAFGLAISNPCFESWLLLHFQDALPATARCDEIEQALRQVAGGYRKTSLDAAVFRPLVGQAAARARAADPDPAAR